MLRDTPATAAEARGSDERAGAGTGAGTAAPLEEAGPSGRCEPAPEAAAHRAEAAAVSYIWLSFDLRALKAWGPSSGELTPFGGFGACRTTRRTMLGLVCFTPRGQRGQV
jgi:hypothetical protein